MRKRYHKDFLDMDRELVSLLIYSLYYHSSNISDLIIDQLLLWNYLRIDLLN
jgi:hypothetical protein